jgi:hypothetical protein
MHSSISTSIVCAATVMAPHGKADLQVYSYISPEAQPTPNVFGLSENDLVRYVKVGLRARGIHAIDPNRVYDGSEDALRIDIRPENEGFVVELSVRQGVTVHNMLQRWASRESLLFPHEASKNDMGKALLARIEQLLDRLKANFRSKTYRNGLMMEP